MLLVSILVGILRESIQLSQINSGRLTPLPLPNRSLMPANESSQDFSAPLPLYYVQYRVNDGVSSVEYGVSSSYSVLNIFCSFLLYIYIVYTLYFILAQLLSKSSFSHLLHYTIHYCNSLCILSFNFARQISFYPVYCDFMIMF